MIAAWTWRTGAGLAAAGFGVYALSVALVRVAGDRLIRRLGRARAVQLGELVAAAGAGGIVIAPASSLPWRDGRSSAPGAPSSRRP